MSLEFQGSVNNMEKVKRRKDTGSILKRYIKSFCHAVDGIIYAIENEMNILIMMIATLVAFALSFFLNISKIELCLVVICIGVVMVSELINSAIEACVDLETTEKHPLAKIAKDCASGASLIASIMALFVGCIIFIPKIVALF